MNFSACIYLKNPIDFICTYFKNSFYENVCNLNLFEYLCWLLLWRRPPARLNRLGRRRRRRRLELARQTQTAATGEKVWGRLPSRCPSSVRHTMHPRTNHSQTVLRIAYGTVACVRLSQATFLHALTFRTAAQVNGALLFALLSAPTASC